MSKILENVPIFRLRKVVEKSSPVIENYSIKTLT